MSVAVIRRIETSPNSPNLIQYNADATEAGNAAASPVIVEATISETHAKTATVTRHPVEDGFDVTDFVRPGILGLEMEIAFSNSPITELPENDGVFAGAPPTRIQAAWDAMLDLIDGRPSRQLLQVQTGLKLYDRMLVTSIGTSQSADNPEAIVIRVEMEQVRVVNSSTAKVQVKNIRTGEDQNRAQGTVNLGEQVIPLLLECEDCAILCATCLKRDQLNDNDSDETPVFQPDQVCQESGTFELSKFGRRNKSEAQKREACVQVTQSISVEYGRVADKRVYTIAQGLDAVTVPPETLLLGLP